MALRTKKSWSRVLWLACAGVATLHCGALFPRFTTLARPAPAGLAEAGEITPAPDTVHRLSVLSAQVPRLTRDGRAWDEGGLPDPVVVLQRNGSEIFHTSVLHDNERPTWDPAREFADVMIEPSDVLRVELYDDDGLGRELVGYAEVRGGVPSDARNGGNWTVRLEGGATVSLRTTPPPPQLGLGVGWEFHSDYALVLSVERAGPAYGSGLRVGDRITTINNQTVSAMGENDTRQGLDRGAYSDLNLVVQRNGSPLTLEIHRDALYPVR